MIRAKEGANPSRLGRSSINVVRGVGRAMQLLWQILGSSYVVVLRPREFFLQLYSVGVLSLLIVSISGIFVGMVLALQGYYILSRFAAEAMLGQPRAPKGGRHWIQQACPHGIRPPRCLQQVCL